MAIPELLPTSSDGPDTNSENYLHSRKEDCHVKKKRGEHTTNKLSAFLLS